MKKQSITWLLILFMGLSLQGRAQGLGTPFFNSFNALQYKAHPRNFGIACDREGCVFVANFEGLLHYDGYQWTINHTPDNMRVTAVFTAKDGRIWFGGPSVLGYVGEKDAITYVADGKNQKERFEEVVRIYEEQGTIRFTTTDGQLYGVQTNKIQHLGKAPIMQQQSELYGDNILSSVTADGNTYYGTSNSGLYIQSSDGKREYHITTDNDLPSNCINALAYDGLGTIWGATDNGVFRMKTLTCLTYYYKPEGIDGMVSCLAKQGDRLLIGMENGMKVLQNGIIQPVQGIHHTCYAMAKLPSEEILVASADGVFTYQNGTLRRITDKHTLSLFVEPDGSFLAGELDGVYHYTLQGRCTLVDKIRNVSKFKQTQDGTLWLINLDNLTYYRTKGSQHFQQKATKLLTNLFEYFDDQGNRWTSFSNGEGLVCDHKQAHMETFIRALKDIDCTSMLIQDGVAWIGGTNSLIRWDLKLTGSTTLRQPHLYLRRYELTGKHLFCAFANDVQQTSGSTLYRYRLHQDDAWSSWQTKQELDFPDLSAGDYQFCVQSMDVFGLVAISEVKEFSIPYPWYMRWYAGLLYVALAMILAFSIFRWRIHRMRKEKERLEATVEKRTSELRETQTKLIRKEKEATVGKLTSGLIDRILNPMNYINNFSHLTLGLVNDLKEDIEDEQENMSADNYEDCQDVLDMMHQNVSKIEQHGLATTRILKAMEEMLRDRTGKVEEMDLVPLCQSDLEKLQTYCAKDFERLHIQVEWQGPTEPVMAIVNAEMVSKTLMSMLFNSAYYLIKKIESGNLSADYKPTIRLSLSPRSEGKPISLHIYDNGTGIEASIINKIFDPFFTTKPTSEASGVGLYLSQQIIQDLGGSIKVESTKGEYTEFIITLP